MQSYALHILNNASSGSIFARKADIRVPARRGDSIEQTTNRVIAAIDAHDPAILEAE